MALTDEDKALAVKMFASGAGYTEIARVINCNPTTVRYWVLPEYAKSKRRDSSEKSWRNKYGIVGMTHERYEQLSNVQGGVCAICSRPPDKGKRLAVDHDHGTGEPRGLLCFRCNTLLGFIENPVLMQKVNAYLHYFNETPNRSNTDG